MQGFADLLRTETSLGIVDGDAVIQTMMERGLPRNIFDVRGALRMALARVGETLEVTTYTTELSIERLLSEIGVPSLN